jgi:undecaprenyl-diphosphatase
VLCAASSAHAQQAPAPVPPPPLPSASAAPPPAPAADPAEVRPPTAPVRKTDLVPTPAEPKPGDAKIRFVADPLGDGAILATSAGLAGIMELVLSTGEIRPQQIDPSFDNHSLLTFDQTAITQTIDPNASLLSSVGLYTAVGFAVLDPILSGFRDGREAALVDAVMYAQAASMTLGITDIAKVAVRRPRPIAYIDRNKYLAQGGIPANYNNTSTDSAMSFVSGHASTTATISAVATYLAFARSPNTARPWITLVGGVLLTGFVSYERVRAGAHFPSDVIAGALAGTGVGLVVTHLHREDRVQQRPIWVGFAPASGGGTMSLSGRF